MKVSRIAVKIGVRSLPRNARQLEKRLREVSAAAAAVAGAQIVELSVVVVGDHLMRRLNREFHGVDETTDVLAFPFEEGARIDGEVIVCAPCARREGDCRGIAWETELALYVAHGVLHLSGEDDHLPADAMRMRRLERRALTRVGLLLPNSHLRELKDGGLRRRGSGNPRSTG